MQKDYAAWLDSMVCLNRRGMKNRASKMAEMDGIVVGIVEYQVELAPEVYVSEIRFKVDWGNGQIWTENPEFLVKI